ncbi:hypothetical protein [uncultured Brevundimonas sp.]|uniref:hypothetical protein n=1 Tax=uncultured Brevundimonas sp. TaxID=213418 RepID=UPI00260C3E58|nr:hypothetical protein [uncultured Brevundimonas sp.]
MSIQTSAGEIVVEIDLGQAPVWRRAFLGGDDLDNEVEIRTMSFSGDMPNRCMGAP